MSDLLLARLTYEPRSDLTPIDWPKGLAPKPTSPAGEEEEPLGHADVLVVTWTSAEWMALADVLTPGIHKTNWFPYTNNWDKFEPHLTDRSPARDARCLGEWCFTQIGDKYVLCFHSQLHLAVDDDTAPIVELWKQIITEVEPALIITTGTAGGIGASTSLGDVFICNSAKFNCTKTFKDKPWAQERFSNSCTISGENLELARTKLAQVNAEKLPADLAPRGRKITGPHGFEDVIIFLSDNTGDVETVDYFGFDDTDDSYGIVRDDSLANTEEMDDATLPLALSQMGSSVPWLSVRNASDPMVPSSLGSLEEQSKWASQIYNRWGYTTTVGSAVACWALIADMWTIPREAA